MLFLAMSTPHLTVSFQNFFFLTLASSGLFADLHGTPWVTIQPNAIKSHHCKSCLATIEWPVQTLYPPLPGVLTRVTLTVSRELGFHTTPQVSPQF